MASTRLPCQQRGSGWDSPLFSPVFASYHPGISRIVRKSDGVAQTSLFGDYKEVDGLTVPHTIAQYGGEFALEITLTKVEIDADIADGTFDLPAEVAPE